MECQYTTQGFYKCQLPSKSSEVVIKKNDDNILKYIASDAQYDMQMKSMLYQLRVTPNGYRKHLASEDNL